MAGVNSHPTRMREGFMASLIGKRFVNTRSGSEWVLTAATAYGGIRIVRQHDGKRVECPRDLIARAMLRGILTELPRVDPDRVREFKPSTSVAWTDIENGTTTWHYEGFWDDGKVRV